MNTNRTPIKISWLVSALALALSFQSCNKEDKSAMPSPTAASQAQGAVVVPCKEVCLVAGQNTRVGTVGVGVDGDNIVVTYTITAPNVYLMEAHVDLFDNLADFGRARKLSGGGAIPGKFAFQQSFSSGSRTTTYTATIPKAYADNLNSSDGCYYVATHAALSTGDTAWGGLCTSTPTGVTLNGALQFPGSNWGVYFEFCKSMCPQTITTLPINFTYAWEDLNGSGNDADYNDFVVQANVVKSQAEMKITFLATARGAGFDHKFRFKIAKTGIVGGIAGISGASSVTQDATNYYVTVFESTKAALPPSPGASFANTEPRQTACTPFAYKEVKLAIDSTFPYNSAIPYEPYLSVYRSGDATSGLPNYDLYIYQLSNRDTWTTTDGKLYPNGIVIPSDWRWPYENVSINGRTSGVTIAGAPYPSFTSIDEGFTPLWYNNLANPAATFNKTICGF